jgi:thiamine biosynthesis lipoprotein ApbE
MADIHKISNDPEAFILRMRAEGAVQVTVGELTVTWGHVPHDHMMPPEQEVNESMRDILGLGPEPVLD